MDTAREKLEDMMDCYLQLTSEYPQDLGHLADLLYIVEPSERMHILRKQGRLPGYTALHRAAKLGHTELIKTILASLPHRDRLEALTTSEVTPLHVAARSGDLELVKAILNNLSGHQQYILLTREAERQTACDWASELDHKDVVAFLHQTEALGQQKEDVESAEGLANGPSSITEDKPEGACSISPVDKEQTEHYISFINQSLCNEIGHSKIIPEAPTDFLEKLDGKEFVQNVKTAFTHKSKPKSGLSKALEETNQLNYSSAKQPPVENSDPLGVSSDEHLLPISGRPGIQPTSYYLHAFAKQANYPVQPRSAETYSWATPDVCARWLSPNRRSVNPESHNSPTTDFMFYEKTIRSFIPDSSWTMSTARRTEGASPRLIRPCFTTCAVQPSSASQNLFSFIPQSAVDLFSL